MADITYHAAVILKVTFPLRIALIGLGHAGQKHREVLLQLPGVQLAAVADAVLQPDWPEVNAYKSVEALLQTEKDLDIAIIATPNGLHEAQTLLCLEHGLHVIVEKPLAISGEGAQHIARKAAEKGKKVFCVMQNRHTPVMQWLKTAVSGGHLNNPFLIQINCFWNRDDRYYASADWRGRAGMDGGPLFTQFSHFMDALLWLFGDVQQIESAFFSNITHQHNTDYEDTGLVTMTLANGAKAIVHYTTAIPQRNAESSLTILTPTVALKVAGQYMNEVTYCIAPPDFPASPVLPASNHDYRLEALEYFFKEIQSDNTTDSNLHEAVRVVKLIETIYARKTALRS